MVRMFGQAHCVHAFFKGYLWQDGKSDRFIECVVKSSVFFFDAAKVKIATQMSTEDV